MKGKILVIDDEVALQKALTRYLKKLGYDADGVNTAPEAIERCKSRVFDLVISDLKMPAMSGIELMREIKKLNPDVAFVIMTGFGTIESAIEAIKEGAFHYITKPFDINDMGLLVDKAVRYHNLSRQNEILQKQVKGLADFKNIIGCSDGLKDVLQMLEKVLDTDSNVLILGESGTGKELVAKAIHYNGKRSAQMLITVNCGAIPENLLETELFGHVRGAFTGAISSNVGKFELAHGGTIFLDEIGDMSLKLQVKLLRVLQERKFEAVGSTESISVDVRVIAATNQNLEDLVARGLFREDLYYRLNVIPISVPPLRERVCDIPLLVNHFLERFCQRNNIARPAFSNEVMEILNSYKWPGNVRELENTIERLVILRPGQKVLKEDLPEKFTELNNAYFSKSIFNIPDNGISLKNLVDEFENSLIIRALNKTNWNKNRAATLLRLNRTTLVEKLKKRNLTKEGPTDGLGFESLHDD